MEQEEPKKRTTTKKIRAVTYQTNPFMAEKMSLVKTKTKRITNNRGGYIIKADDGEIVSPLAGFWTAEQVDSTKFVKLYVNGVKAFSDLTSSGTKVFEFLYHVIQDNIGKDKIYLGTEAMSSHNIKIPKTTFYRGLEELINKKFIAPTEFTNFFWVNPDYLWNGDRLSFVKTYVKTSIPRDTKTVDMFTDKLIGLENEEEQN